MLTFDKILYIIFYINNFFLKMDTKKISLDKLVEIIKTTSSISSAHRKFCDFYHMNMCLGSFRNMLERYNLFKPKKRIQIKIEK